MNGLDWLLAVLIGTAAVRGFFRGFVVEICALLAWILGIWAATHLSDHVGRWIGLEPDQEVLAFGITFLLVLVGVHLLARVITKALDLAELSLPNKMMGVVFGAVRSAFVLSVLLNVLDATPIAGVNERLEKASTGSALYVPVRGFAPMIIPALGRTKWVRRVIDDVKREGEELMDRACPDRSREQVADTTLQIQQGEALFVSCGIGPGRGNNTLSLFGHVGPRPYPVEMVPRQ